MPRSWYPRLTERARRCLFAAQIAVTSYIGDVKTNIRALVQAMIDQGLASHEREDISTARDRKHFLGVWMTSEYPLGFGEKTFPALLRAIALPGSSLKLSLGNKKAMSTHELACLICDMVRPIRAIPLQAPLIAKSPSLSVFRVAFAYILKQATDGGFADPPSFVIHAFAQMFDRHQVSHVPWSPPVTVATAGRVLRKVNFNFWRSTSKSQEAGHLALMNVVDAQAQAALADERLAHDIALSDAKAPWALLPLTIGELPSVMHKTVLPDDFDLAHASLASGSCYITKTYEWVSTHYRGGNHMHLFALLVAHIFSRMTPNLGHPAYPSWARQRQHS